MELPQEIIIVIMFIGVQPHIYAETVSRIHTLHTMHNTVCASMSVSVCLLNKNPNWCAGTKCNRYSMYVKKVNTLMAWRERQLPFCGMQKFLWLPDKSRTL